MKRIDPAPILAQLKGFQRDTVEYAFERLYLAKDSTHRFLVADEVGLGKTLVAKGVVAKAIDHLWDKVDRIDVVYICSNAEIARQNINRLNLIEESDFARASRITLLPTVLHEFHGRKVNFIAFTPGTSFEMSGGSGIRDERALLYWLLQEGWELGRRRSPLNVLQGDASPQSFRKRVESVKSLGPRGRAPYDRKLAESFWNALEARPQIRERFEELCGRFPKAKKNVPKADRQDRNALVGDLRTLLARVSLEALEPDLVILDEFQRFRDLLDGHSEAAELAKDLFSYADETTSVRALLLSATPYKMYTLAHEQGEDDHYRDFLRTVQFLTKDQAGTDNFQGLLRRYREALFNLPQAGSRPLLELKREIEVALRRVMARTERVGTTQKHDAMLREVVANPAELTPKDVHSFAKLDAIAAEVGQPGVVEYWKSAPYLLSFMRDYKLKKEVMSRLEEAGGRGRLAKALRESPELYPSWPDVESYKELDPSNARLRGLLDELDALGTWKLLWVPPCAPPYPLEAPFDVPAARGFTKRLIFSSWNVVPRVISALASYAAERAIFHAAEAEPENTPEARARRSGRLEFTQDASDRLRGMPVVALLYPSPTLSEVAASAFSSGPERSLGEVIDVVESRIGEMLLPFLREASEEGVEDEQWYWVAPLLLDRGSDQASQESWLVRKGLAALWVGDEGAPDAGWARHVAEFQKRTRPRLGRPPGDLTRVLALLALAGPANASLRALAGLSGASLWAPSLRDAAGTMAWALRRLFNQPERIAVVRGNVSEDVPYWRQVLLYSAAGALPAVLSEYLHVLKESEGLFGPPEVSLATKLAEAFQSVPGLTTAPVRMDEFTREGRALRPTEHRMRTHVAVRFAQDKATEKDAGDVARPDAVRAAFNSPFWPFVLATTSVGQEGLDFHNYCHAVVHWNLPSNPVDLEQREGRIHRYKGHAIRKNVALRFAGLPPSHPAAGTDPWERLFQAAALEGDGGSRGLSPYWLFPLEDGASIERHVPALPFTRDRLQLEDLRRSLAVYRMVFGQPRQDDLLAYLLEHVSAEELEKHRDELRIDLGPPHAGGQKGCAYP